MGIGRKIFWTSFICMSLIAGYSQKDRIDNNLRHITQKAHYALTDQIGPKQTTKDIGLQLEDIVHENSFGLDERYRFSECRLNQYESWINDTIDYSKEKKTTAIIVDKAAYELYLYKSGELLETFNIELGKNPYDDKIIEGDMATPEGMYSIVWFRDEGETSFYKSLLIDYPNSSNEETHKKLKGQGKLPFGSTPGSLIHIHGHGSGNKGSKKGRNWTHGCVALSNYDMDKIDNSGVREGTPVTIVRYGKQKSY